MAKKKSKPTPAQIAKEEAASQAVIFLFTVATAVAAILIHRVGHDPDFLRTARMRTARAAERACATVAARAWSAAERCRLAYERETA